MRKHARLMVFGVLVAMIGLSGIVRAEDKDADKKAKDKLQGTWNAVSGENGGTVILMEGSRESSHSDSHLWLIGTCLFTR